MSDDNLTPEQRWVIAQHAAHMEAVKATLLEFFDKIDVQVETRLAREREQSAQDNAEAKAEHAERVRKHDEYNAAVVERHERSLYLSERLAAAVEQLVELLRQRT